MLFFVGFIPLKTVHIIIIQNPFLMKQAVCRIIEDLQLWLTVNITSRIHLNSSSSSSRHCSMRSTSTPITSLIAKCKWLPVAAVYLLGLDASSVRQFVQRSQESAGTGHRGVTRLDASLHTGLCHPIHHSAGQSQDLNFILFYLRMQETFSSFYNWPAVNFRDWTVFYCIIIFGQSAPTTATYIIK